MRCFAVALLFQVLRAQHVGRGPRQLRRASRNTPRRRPRARLGSSGEIQTENREQVEGYLCGGLPRKRKESAGESLLLQNGPLYACLLLALPASSLLMHPPGRLSSSFSFLSYVCLWLVLGHVSDLPWRVPVRSTRKTTRAAARSRGGKEAFGV